MCRSDSEHTGVHLQGVSISNIVRSSSVGVGVTVWVVLLLTTMPADTVRVICDLMIKEPQRVAHRKYLRAKYRSIWFKSTGGVPRDPFNNSTPNILSRRRTRFGTSPRSSGPARQGLS
jgi:hypothetical protein